MTTPQRIPFEWQVPARFNFGADVVDRIAREDDHLALIWADAEGAEERYRFSDIARLSNQLANVLASAGVRRGERVIVMLRRLPQWQIAMVAAMKVGAVPIPCIEMLTERDLAYRIEHGEVVAAITTRANVGKFGALARRFKARLSVGGAEDGWSDYAATVAGASTEFTPAVLEREEPAVMYYTSGSTGHPKGVVHATRGIFAWRGSAEHWLDLSRRDTMWCTADTGWSKAGTSIIFGPWSQGATVLFYDGPFEPRRRLELLQKHRVTVYCAAATEIRRLCAEDVAAYDLSALRQTVSAGEAVSPAIVAQWTALTGKPLREAYGQTETLMTVCNLRGDPLRTGSMGRALPGTELAILGPGGELLPDGEQGMIAVRLPNPQLMLGYWKDEARTADAIRETPQGRFFQTGDLGRRDANGYFYYAGRADDVINSAGYRIGPLEVEYALTEHASVQECAVVASPSDERGEVVKAFVVLRPGWEPTPALAKELQEHVKKVTAPYKYPRRIEFSPALPKTSTGKISRRALRDREFEGR
jgi:acyl-coenzyme A synthetase/AMP-(fatty) acid ligase